MSDIFLDTNFLVYGFDDSAPTKQQAVWDLLESNNTFAISTQVLLEFYVVVTQKLDPAVTKDAARDAVRLLCELPVIKTDAALVQRAIDCSIAQQLSLWDAMILEAAVEAGCHQLWTEDLAHGSILRGVGIVNPFT